MSKKQLIAAFLDATLISRFLFWAGNKKYGQHIRVINYHRSGPKTLANFEQQLQFYAQNYRPVDYKDLQDFFASGKWIHNKPGLIISFDDGFRENYDYAVPLLEKYGFKGWFFIPTGYVDASSTDQMEYIGKTSGKYDHTYEDGRYFMNWAEIDHLRKKHVVGCHTYTHHRMNINDTNEILEHEVREAKQVMEQKLNHEITIFCWVGGEEHTYSKAAAEKIKNAGYKYSFMTNSWPLTAGQSPLQIQRSNIEANNPISLVRFQLSPLMDRYFTPKRLRVCALTNV